MPEFMPRLTDAGMRGSPYWYDWNPFYLSGNGLPNCTCYAWGRVYEATGIRPRDDCFNGNARDWCRTSQAYRQGMVPMLGAVACWWYEPYGHVAVVEQIYPDGTVVVSESGYSSQKYFKLATIRPENGYLEDWMPSSGYYLQGFIYPDGVSGLGANYQWISFHDYESTSYRSPEIVNNCYCLASALLVKGWSINAICGLLGNAIYESYMAPDMQEVGGTGFGIVQWTPPEKLTDWLDAEGYTNWRTDIQVLGYGEADRIDWEIDNYPQWIATGSYPLSFREFSTSTQTPEYLASAFLYDYERPASYATEQIRRDNATWIYGIFMQAPPGMLVPTGRGEKKDPNKLTLWQMIRYH